MMKFRCWLRESTHGAACLCCVQTMLKESECLWAEHRVPCHVFLMQHSSLFDSMPGTWEADDRHGPRPNEIYPQVGETDIKFLNSLWQQGVATVFSAVDEKVVLLPEWTQSCGYGRIFWTSDTEPRIEGGVRLSQAKKKKKKERKKVRDRLHW